MEIDSAETMRRMWFFIFSFGLARHGRDGVPVSQVQLRQSIAQRHFLKSLNVLAEFRITIIAILVRENRVSVPKDGFRRGMRFHFGRARFPWIVDRTYARDRRQGPHNRR